MGLWEKWGGGILGGKEKSVSRAGSVQLTSAGSRALQANMEALDTVVRGLPQN